MVVSNVTVKLQGDAMDYEGRAQHSTAQHAQEPSGPENRCD